MDLKREEIDLPFNCYVYYGGFLGMAPMTYVHGVEIHLAGVLSNIENITLHHGGYLWHCPCSVSYHILEINGDIKI
jgi:hypothetical protein